jgi:hypothetical protein
VCEKGTEVLMEVPIPAHLSHTGEARMAVKGIDACIAPIVAALNAGGIATTGCCCGHGKRAGDILLLDGRTLLVLDFRPEPDEAGPQYKQGHFYTCSEIADAYIAGARDGRLHGAAATDHAISRSADAYVKSVHPVMGEPSCAPAAPPPTMAKCTDLRDMELFSCPGR